MLPLVVKGQSIGLVELMSRTAVGLDPERLELARTMANEAAMALENARLYEQAHRRQDWLQASTQITRQLLSAEGEEPLQLIARQAPLGVQGTLASARAGLGRGPDADLTVAAGRGLSRRAGLISAIAIPVSLTAKRTSSSSGSIRIVMNGSGQSVVRMDQKFSLDIGRSPVWCTPAPDSRLFASPTPRSNTSGRRYATCWRG